MITFQHNLASFLDNASRLAILSIGSRLRGDDAAGLLAAAHARRRLAKSPPAYPTAFFHGDTAPENLTGQIKSFRPSHLLILDAADSSNLPGTMDLIDPAALSSNLSASTHSLPIKLIIDFITTSTPCKVVIIGIQPSSVHFGDPVSSPVRLAVRSLARTLADALQNPAILSPAVLTS